MRADDDVDRSVPEPGDDFALPGRRVEARQGADDHGVVGEPVAEGPGMLGDEDGGRSEHRDLLPVLHGLECRPDGDFGLAVAGVAAHETIHHAGRLHVALDVLGGGVLVGRVLVEERRLHLPLPAGVRGECVPRTRTPGRVEFQQLGGHLPDRGLGPALQPLPAPAAYAVQARGPIARMGSDPALDLVEPVDRHAQDLAAGVADDQRLDRLAADLHPLQAPEPTDAVIHVDDVVTGRELGKTLQRRGAAVAPAPPEFPAPPEDLVVRQDIDGRHPVVQAKPLGERADHHVATRRGTSAPVREQIVEPAGLSAVVTEDEGLRPRRGLLRDERPQPADVPLEGRWPARLEDNAAHVLLDEDEPGVAGDALLHRAGGKEDGRGVGGGIAVAKGIAVAGLRLLPRHLGTLRHRTVADPQQDRAVWQAVEERALRPPSGVDGAGEPHGQDVHPLHHLGRPLVQDAEVADGLDLVPPEFDSGRTRRPVGEHIDQASAHGVAARLLDHGRAFESPRLQGLDQRVPAQVPAGRNHEAQVGQIVRDRGQFLERAVRGDHHPRPPRQQRLDGFDPLPFGFAPAMVVPRDEVLALRVRHHRSGAHQHLQVAQVLDGVAGRGRGEEPEAVGEVVGERRDCRHGQRAGGASHDEAVAGRWKACSQRTKRGCAGKRGRGGVFGRGVAAAMHRRSAVSAPRGTRRPPSRGRAARG